MQKYKQKYKNSMIKNPRETEPQRNPFVLSVPL